MSWFWIISSKLAAKDCKRRLFSDEEKENSGFLEKAGVLTFLKTSTQLQIWFDDVLEVTWVYEDFDSETSCTMTKSMTGLKFRIRSDVFDKVSTHYRYEIGDIP